MKRFLENNFGRERPETDLSGSKFQGSFKFHQVLFRRNFFIITSNLNSYEVNLQVNQISVVISPFISFLILHNIVIYHLMNPTSNSISMYLLGTVCCQHIHPSQIRRWILTCTHHFDF